MKPFGLFLGTLALLASCQTTPATKAVNPVLVSGTLQLLSRSPEKFSVTLNSSPKIGSGQSQTLMITFFQGSAPVGGTGSSYWAGLKSIEATYQGSISETAQDLVVFLDQNGNYRVDEEELQMRLVGVTPSVLTAGVAFALAPLPPKLPAADPTPETTAVNPTPALVTTQPTLVVPASPPEKPVSLPVKPTTINDWTDKAEIRLSLVNGDPARLALVFSPPSIQFTGKGRRLMVRYFVGDRFAGGAGGMPFTNRLRYEIQVYGGIETDSGRLEVFIDRNNNQVPDDNEEAWLLPGVDAAGLRAGLRYAVDWKNPLARAPAVLVEPTQASAPLIPVPEGLREQKKLKGISLQLDGYDGPLWVYSTTPYSAFVALLGTPDSISGSDGGGATSYYWIQPQGVQAGLQITDKGPVVYFRPQAPEFSYLGIRVGTTTYAEFTKMLGEPEREDHFPGEDRWSYEKAHGLSISTSQGRVTGYFLDLWRYGEK